MWRASRRTRAGCGRMHAGCGRMRACCMQRRQAVRPGQCVHRTCHGHPQTPLSQDAPGITPNQGTHLAKVPLGVRTMLACCAGAGAAFQLWRGAVQSAASRSTVCACGSKSPAARVRELLCGPQGTRRARSDPQAGLRKAPRAQDRTGCAPVGKGIGLGHDTCSGAAARRAGGVACTRVAAHRLAAAGRAGLNKAVHRRRPVGRGSGDAAARVVEQRLAWRCKCTLKTERKGAGEEASLLGGTPGVGSCPVLAQYMGVVLQLARRAHWCYRRTPPAGDGPAQQGRRGWGRQGLVVFWGSCWGRAADKARGVGEGRKSSNGR